MRLNVEASGDGEDLVLLHGWGMNAAVWDGLPGQFSERRRLHRVELPGHGASPFDSSRIDRGQWAQAVLDAAPRRAVWIAWSLGGLIALEAALRAPERMSALILVTASPRFIRAADWPAAMPAETLARFHAGLLADPSAMVLRFLALQVRGSDAARDTLRMLRSRLVSAPGPRPDALALGLDLLRSGDLRGRLPGLVPPTLWLFGDRDTLVPAAVAEGVAALLPAARLQVISGAGHAPFLSHPKETSRAITSFLGGVA